MEIAEGPVPISIRKIPDDQQTDIFCREIIPGKGSGAGQLIETDDEVLRRIPPGEGGAQQIVIVEAFHSRLLNLIHHEKLAGHPGQTKMYACFKKSSYWP